jgi:hypothetical protein
MKHDGQSDGGRDSLHDGFHTGGCLGKKEIGVDFPSAKSRFVVLLLMSRLIPIIETFVSLV